MLLYSIKRFNKDAAIFLNCRIIFVIKLIVSDNYLLMGSIYASKCGFVGGLVGAFEGGEVFVEEEVDAAGGVVVGRGGFAAAVGLGGFAIGGGFAAVGGGCGFGAGGELAVPAGEGGAVPLEWCTEVGGVAAAVEGVGDGAEEGVLVDGGVAVCHSPEGGENMAVEGVGRCGCAAGDAVQDVVVDDHCQGVGGAHVGNMGVDGVDPCLGGVVQGR